MTRFALALVLFACVGCLSVERRILANPGRNEVVRVNWNERLYFTLPEDSASGASWRYACDDPDVEVTLDRQPREVAVRIRVGRGFNGPATIRLTCKRDGDPAEKDFTLVLFKRTGDVAFWK